jgi:hypothetical protein
MSTGATASSIRREAADPPGIPGNGFALASMGIYVFETKFLMDSCAATPPTEGSSRDFGKDIIPYIVKNGKAVAHRFTAPACARANEEEAYWRDVGTVDAYWEANIDLTDVTPGTRHLRPRLADLDLCRDHAAGQVRARRGRAARLGGEPRWCRATASSRAARSESSCCSPACACNSYSELTRRWCCRTHDRPQCAAAKVVVDAA